MKTFTYYIWNCAAEEEIIDFIFIINKKRETIFCVFVDCETLIPNYVYTC